MHKNQQSRQTGSRNLTDLNTLPITCHTYMKPVTKYQISSGSGGIINMNSTHNTDILATFDSQMLILFLLFYLLKSTAEAGRTLVRDLSTFSFVSRYFLTVCTSIGNCGLWYLSRAATILDLYSFSLLHITTNLYFLPSIKRKKMLCRCTTKYQQKLEAHRSL